MPKAFLTSLIGIPIDQLPAESFRKKQIADWLYKKGVESIDDMSNLSKELREELQKEYKVKAFLKAKTSESSDGSVKFLFTAEDNAQTESVFMPFDTHNTVCVSSMLGCPVGCKFCATGSLGFGRNLTAAEIIDQILSPCRILNKPMEAVRNLVFMGMGEPLLNFDEVIKAIKILIDPEGMDFSPRRITVSTVGIPEGIRRLADEDTGVKLALSLHAPDDKTRADIIPVAKNFSIKDIMSAIEYYYSKTKRRITFEYTMLAGVNDSPEQAKQLIKLSKGFASHFNLIPYNPWDGSPYESSDEKTIRDFARILKNAGVDTSIRYSRGRDADAACGQLALKEKQK